MRKNTPSSAFAAPLLILVLILSLGAQDIQVRKAVPVLDEPVRPAALSVTPTSPPAPAPLPSLPVPKAQPVTDAPAPDAPLPGLADVRKAIPDIVIDLRYRTKRNVTRQELYPEDMPCLLYPVTLEKLRLAQQLLRARGYGLKVWDAWRPPEVQLSLFEHGGHTGMFTDPKIRWSRHCSGTAVDVTLVDVEGKELPMPTAYDVGGPAAYYVYLGENKKIREYLSVLQIAMTDAGFSVLDNEWWHFDDAQFNARPEPPVIFARDMNLPLPTIKGRKKR